MSAIREPSAEPIAVDTIARCHGAEVGAVGHDQRAHELVDVGLLYFVVGAAGLAEREEEARGTEDGFADLGDCRRGCATAAWAASNGWVAKPLPAIIATRIGITGRAVTARVAALRSWAATTFSARARISSALALAITAFFP